MNGAVTGPQMWTARRLWTVAVLAAAVQAGLIYWAGDRMPFHARTASAMPAVQLAAPTRSELLTLTDPTVFSRAHPDGFSGPAWLTIRDQPSDAETNAAPQQWLALAPGLLGGNFRDYMRTNPPAAFAIALRPSPAPTRPGALPALTLATASTVQVEGALAARARVNFSPPPSQTNADILLPSEVQLLVDARGNPISAVLLKSSGYKPADQLAVTLARDAQFTPDRDALARSANDPDAGVISGRMIFRWHTVPAPPSANGSPNPR